MYLLLSVLLSHLHGTSNSVVLMCNDNKVSLYSILNADQGLFLKATISIKFFSNMEGLRRFASFFRAQTGFLLLSCRTTFSFPASTSDRERWHVLPFHY